MLTLHPQYITDNTGKKLSAILPISEYNSFIEELDDLRLYDAGKNDTELAIPHNKAMEMIAAERKKLSK